MKVTRPTFLRLTKQPLSMNGYHRATLARALGVSVEVVDVLLNKRNFTPTEIDTVLNLIKPKHEEEYNPTE
jgi:Zn-dependent peptidase ImmA (M78 family)